MTSCFQLTYNFVDSRADSKCQQKSKLMHTYVTSCPTVMPGVVSSKDCSYLPPNRREISSLRSLDSVTFGIRERRYT